MFFKNEEFPWTATLEQNWETVLHELDHLPGNDFAPWPGEELYEGRWNQYPFFAPGQDFPKNRASCPETVKLVQQVPGITMASFAMLEPGAHIKPHKGFSHVVLRFHLALKVPEGEAWLRVGDEKRSWTPGEVFVFDDMYEHEALNATDAPRIVMMCDFLRPFKYRTSLLGHLRQRLVLQRQMRQNWKRVVEASGVEQ